VRCIKEKRRRVCVGVLRDALKSVINVKMVGTQIKALHAADTFNSFSPSFPIARPLA
jgi:hypothetical protein